MKAGPGRGRAALPAGLAVLAGGDPVIDGEAALSKGEHEGRDPA